MHLVWINSETLSFMLRRVSFSVSADTRFAAALSSSAGLMASNFSNAACSARAIDVPGYDRVEVDPAARFIGTMNYGYAGTRELNEALTSRFAVIQMPAIDGDGLDRLLGEEFPTLEKKYRGQFVQLFLDLQKKCESAEISSKALDLRGMLDALRLIRRGISAGTALDMGITNKAFDSYEQGLIRDVIAARIPSKLDRSRLFTD